MKGIINDHAGTLLDALARETDPGRLKVLLEQVPSTSCNSLNLFLQLHDLLLFNAAFPKNTGIRKLADSGLQALIKTASTPRRGKTSWDLSTSGFPGTTITCSFSSRLAGWMVNRFPDDTALAQSGASSETVRNCLQALCPSIEFEQTTQRELNLLTRLKILSGKQDPSMLLQWLLQLIEEIKLPAETREILFNNLNVYLKWTLNDPLFNRSFLRIPVKRFFYQDNFIKQVDSRNIIKQRTSAPLSLDFNQKRHITDTMKASLAFLYRETDPVTYADEKELICIDMGRGLQIALIGMEPGHRLSLESYIGFMAFKNGVPVSYGGGWLFGHQCKIGVNILPAFRKGESAWLFCQVMRAYAQYGGARIFIVKPYQFGKGNPEGITSGAFWFYYKLGFRPVNETIKQEAVKEWEKIVADKKYRTSPAQLKHFATCNLAWNAFDDPLPFIDTGLLSKAITRQLNERFDGSREKAIRQGLSIMRKEQGLTKKILQPNIQKLIESWAILLLLIPGLPAWPKIQKKTLARLMEAKWNGPEINYILQLQQHNLLWKAFKELTGDHKNTQ